jgi:uncharacterized membrane protein
MQLTPIIAIHLTAALLATAVGPVALWARRGRAQHPKLHRAFGYAWVTLMIITALSAVYIRGAQLPNIAGFSPIHLFIPVVLFALVGSFWFLAKGNIRAHRLTMLATYAGGLGAGVFALLPNRYLGNLVWSHLGLM